MNTQLDHIVIGAANLQQGVDYIHERFGIEMPVGGEHPLMGTHNHLMQLGDNTFFEIIAINPQAPAPQSPRWYGLDDPSICAQLQQQPRLLTWVVNHPLIDSLLANTAFNFGKVIPISRGNLNWLFAVPDDGRILAAGLLPYVMQWQTDGHPAQNMTDLGCRLRRIRLYHPYADWLRNTLKSIDAHNWVEIAALPNQQSPYWEVEMETPNGIQHLSSAI